MRTSTLDELRVGIDLRCLADGGLRGISRYANEISAALAARPKVDVVGLSHRPLPVTMPFPVELFRGSREVVAEQVIEARLCKRLDLDVLLCPANRGLPLFAPIPTVLTLHDAVEWDRDLVVQATGKSRIRFSYSSIGSLASASRIITVSKASARAIELQLAVDPRIVDVIYEGAAPHFDNPVCDTDSSEVLRLFQLDPGFVLYVGGFDKKKDVRTLLTGYSRLNPDDRPKLVLAGIETEEVHELRTLAASLDIEDDTRWVGFVDDALLPALYSHARCFVFPAVAEGFGLPVVEAMSLGIPVIAADSASLPEIVGGGGQTFAPGDDVELAAKLQCLLYDEVLHRRWRIAAQARAADFSWDSAAEQTESTLRRASGLTMPAVFGRRFAELRHWQRRR